MTNQMIIRINPAVKDKLNKWIDSIEMEEINYETIEADKVVLLITEKFNAFKKWAKTQIDTL